MTFNDPLKKRVLARVGKKPKTASAIGVQLGHRDGRSVGRVLSVLVRERKVAKAKGHPPTYTKK